MSLVTIPTYLPQIHVPFKISCLFLRTDFSSPWWLLNRSLVRPQNQFGCYGEEVKYLAPNRELNQTWVQKIYQLIYPKSISHLKFLVHIFIPISHPPGDCWIGVWLDHRTSLVVMGKRSNILSLTGNWTRHESSHYTSLSTPNPCPN